MPGTTAEPRFLCHEREIQEGTARGFDPFETGRDSLFVLRRHGKLIAWRNACPHRGYEGAPMAWRKDAYLSKEGSHVICSGHGALFDPETGIGLHGPCKGLALESITITVTQDGRVSLATGQTEEN
jgi:nitrite reductase/ring-hydroxylating ferredoxin subunit